MTGPRRPPDEAARERVRSDLRSTLFVEAGAGSGKTSALVERVVALVSSGEAELAAIAAITFTEKAAAELRDRVRQALTDTASHEGHPEAAARCGAALAQLDGAAIGTLHAFAQRVLAEHPIEAGLPPRLEVLDEVSSSVAFEQRWSSFQDELLADASLERTLLLLFAAGVRPEALRTLARAFEENWDLVEERVPETSAEPGSVRERFAAAATELRAVLDEPCRDPSDRLRLRLDELAEHLRHLETIDDEVALLEALDPEAEPRPPSFKVGNLGRAAAYDDLPGLRARIVEAGARLAAVREDVARACVKRVACALRRFTLEAAAQRRVAGQLHFHDLLVLARALLRDPIHGPGVRARLHSRYRRLLLDEFQDTDPIQVELAVRLAALDPLGDEAGGSPWDEIEVAPGQLFFVGDPKQSIYRFRRADIATYLQTARRFGASSGGVVELTANFRTGEPIIAWVNATFAALMSEPVEVAPPDTSQPAYVPLSPTRPAPRTGPAVAVLGRGEHPGAATAEHLLRAEAAEVTGALGQVLAEGWEVDDGEGGWRRARLGDVAVLVPTRTSLPLLEEALTEAGIPFRTEASSLVYSSRAIRDVLMVVRAVDDPTNHLQVVAALRTPLLACGDDDLFRFRRLRGGSFSYLADQPASVPADDPVRAGLEYLARLHERRHFLSPSQLLTRIVEERRVLELGFSEGRPRDLWRRVRFVIDQARAFGDATGGTLRAYLAWVTRQGAEDARVSEAVLPESDDDAVRILTIHAAKGLEFPITVLSGMSGTPRARRAAAQVLFAPNGEVGYRLGRAVATEEHARAASVEEEMELHERIRLLYVACTRARDHLVVSLHRKARAAAPRPASRTNAELLVAGMGALLDDLPDAGHGPSPAAPQQVAPPPAPPAFEVWAAERAQALASAGRRRTVAATALGDEADQPDLDPGLAKQARDLDLPPWLKGRYGTAVGRAVHGVLQVVDLATGADLEALAQAQCEAEAVPERAEEVCQLVRAALAAPTVREAARGWHQREVYVATPVGGRLLEGYVDLLCRTGEGLVVVDYKTAATSAPEELLRRVDRYRYQGAAYALAVAAAAGETVARVTFVFLTAEGAVEHHLPRLGEVIEEVRSRLGAGSEALSP